MRCIKCLNSLKKCRLISGLCLVLLLLSFCLSGPLSQSVNALDTTTTTTVVGINDFNFDASSGLSYTRSGTKPYIFDSATTGNINVQSRLLYPQITLTNSVNSGFWTLYMDVYVFTQADGQPVITCPNTAVGAKYVLDSCDVISGGSYNYSEVSSGSWSFNNSGTGNLPQNNLYFNSSSVITHYILTLNGHVATSGYDNLINLRGDFLQVNTGIYQLSVSLSNVRFFTSESAESQAVNNQTEQQQQYHDETQQTFDDAQDTADTDSDSSSQQATSSGTTLLAGFTSFVSALTGASASNCVINADLGNMDLGSIDLCQLSPPPAFQAISSIMVIGFTVPLSIALAKKMISLFRSFQT